MSGRLQNQDFKSEAELIAAGATASSLLNDSKIYVTANALNKTLDDAIIDGDIGGGGTGKNYVENPSFKTGTTTGWSLFNTTLTSKIPTGSITAGAASITTFAADNTAGTILEGTYSLKVASTGAITAGHGFISDAFTIDREDYAKVLGFSFAYEKNSGTMDFSGTSANTWAVYIYDVDGAAWIQPAGVYNLVQGSGVGIASGTFQTTATGTQYGIAIICITATSSAVEMRFDDFQLGPQKVLAGAAVSDWVSYTPTISGSPTPSGTNALNAGRWRRVGDSIELNLWLHMGSTGTAGSAVTAIWGLPGGLTVDLSKLARGSNQTVGNVLFWNTSTEFNYVAQAQSTGVAIETAAGGLILASNLLANYQIAITCFLPISGWSSNTVMSSDTDTRVVAAIISGDPASASSGNPIIVPTVSYDTHGAYNSTTGRYTCPVSGFYKLFGSLQSASAATTLTIYKNAVSTQLAGSLDSNGEATFSGMVFCNAGDLIDLRPGGTVDATTMALNIERLSGPATIAASESVIEQWDATGGGNISSGGNTVVFTNKVQSTHGAFNGSTFTAPISGTYFVAWRIQTANQAPNTSQSVYSQINKGLSTYAFGTEVYGNGATIAPTSVGSLLIKLNAGEQISLVGVSSLTTALRTTGLACWINIAKVGN